MNDTADEIRRLQSCINDLISVLALPAIWSGSEPSQILGTLLDVLLTMLRLDVASARMDDWSDGSPIEVTRGRHQARSEGGSAGHPSDVDAMAMASFSLGLQQDGGALVVGSRRAD